MLRKPLAVGRVHMGMSDLWLHYMAHPQDRPMERDN